MLYKMYAIRDLKTGFLTPTIDMNDASAMRNFEHACMNRESLFFTHPEDYALFRIADYETEFGEVIPLAANDLLCSATDFVNKRK